MFLLVMKKIPHDVIGSIAILKFPMNTKFKKIRAKRFLKNYKNINTVVEKIEKVKGRLRKIKTKYLAGEKTKETAHNENNCRFLMNIDEAYFSPRLSNERKIISQEILKKITPKKNKILVMFAGIAPFPIVIAKTLRQNNINAKIISSELNISANKFAKKNVEINKLVEYIEVISGDSMGLSNKINTKFDFIVMPRPNLKNTFLESIFNLSKKGTVVYYYGFGKREKVLKEIKKGIDKKIGNIKIRKAGDIAPGKFRWLAEFVIK